MKMLRKALFWLHLVCGVVAGVVIVIMSSTGVAIAFEHQILAWIDRDVARVTAPDGTAPKSLAELDLALAAQHPDFQTSQVLAEVCHTRVIIPDGAEDSSTRVLSLRDGQTVLQLALPAVRGIAVNLRARSGLLHIISPGDSVLLTLAAAAGEVAAADWRGALHQTLSGLA